MNQMLIKSQDGKFTGMCKFLGVGRREPKQIIGEELKALMDEKEIDADTLTKEIDVNKNVIKRLLDNEEIPKKEVIAKITKYFEVASDYFGDKELENVIVTDNNIIVARYESNERAMEVKKQLDEVIFESFRKNFNVIVEFPEK